MVISLLKRVVYVSQNKEQILPYSILTDLICITEVVCVYCSVRAAPLYKTDYISTLRG
jgi:hypothetical protein